MVFHVVFIKHPLDFVYVCTFCLWSTFLFCYDFSLENFPHISMTVSIWFPLIKLTTFPSFSHILQLNSSVRVLSGSWQHLTPGIRLTFLKLISNLIKKFVKFWKMRFKKTNLKKWMKIAHSEIMNLVSALQFNRIKVDFKLKKIFACNRLCNELFSILKEKWKNIGGKM